MSEGADSISDRLRDRLSQRKDERTGSMGTLRLSDEEAYVGDEITLKGRNLSEDTTFELVWHTVQGKWGVIEGNEVLGTQYRPRTETMMQVRTDEDGDFTETWEIPEDYGGEHTIELKQDGNRVTTAEITVVPWFEIDRTQAPLGEAFTVIGYGLGPGVERSNYQITWDNGMVGFVTGVVNRGTATAEIRAVGPTGDHVIDVWRNYRGVPFLQNNTQSPFGPVAGERRSSWQVTVTEPETRPETMWVDPRFDESPLPVHLPDPDEATDAELEIEPASGQPGDTAFLSGRNFPPETEVDLVWYTHGGHRPLDIQISPQRKPDVLPTVTTDEDGRFEIEFEIPPEIGSTRPITAEIDGQSVAVTGFMMQADVVDMYPKKGPVGTEITFEMTGIGWPVYENSYYFTYDNHPLGYVCSLDEEEGIIRTKLKATGEPGLHFIDAYPSIFEMEEEEPDFTMKPHLSYWDNHPVRPLPALHFTFEVTEE